VWYPSPIVRRHTLAGVLGGLALATTCAKAPVTNKEDAATTSIDAGVAVSAETIVDAGLLRFAVVLSVRGDAGPESIADSGELEPTAALSVWVPLRLKDFRVRLFDDHDQLVPSDDTVTDADAGIDYQLELLQPLRAGRRYSLLVDAEVGSVIIDEQGRAWDDVRVDLKVRGEPQSDDSKKPVRDPAKKRMRRR
jgi:hypothetical protein